MSDFILSRVEFGDDFTIGDLSIGGHRICWVVEDAVREIPGQPVEDWKIKGETAIPVGRYQIKRTFSNRFQVTMPQLMDVPGFSGIRIHPGNTAQDTEGCLLPGLERRTKGVGSSQLAYREVLKWLDSIEQQDLEAWIQVVGGAGMNSAMPSGLPTYNWGGSDQVNVFAWILAQAAAIKRQRMVAEAYERMIRHARRVGAKP